MERQWLPVEAVVAEHDTELLQRPSLTKENLIHLRSSVYTVVGVCIFGRGLRRVQGRRGRMRPPPRSMPRVVKGKGAATCVGEAADPSGGGAAAFGAPGSLGATVVEPQDSYWRLPGETRATWPGALGDELWKQALRVCTREGGHSSGPGTRKDATTCAIGAPLELERAYFVVRRCTCF
ncbi:hypothetical protein CYMTET_49258 [Cymbomonas tetramitiformis]|uniref:Uncharacterized protein n=1 Tax=Cymbomonas tetramitiformis TaxID=36881 RepID=A0AAE0EU26_9CHLO|nr:hypothetical protein CYMTET_49258 [Cymbomonas tetramitiformis]